MKEYCVDLEIAKELKENEFPQNTFFIWSKDREGDLITKKIFGNPYSEECTNAPTSDEILKELPNNIKDPNFHYFYHLKIEKSPIHDEMYLISYGITNQDRAWMEQYHIDDKKLSNALAKMWLYLKKEGYIK